ncbi:S-adenosylmethionine:tRNA ribosyltransferase-isomerase [Actinomadura bangladeshensis]|uniref:S-adenosylmethionine:tRNA ribosyltransferase-isomerase n=1 Tax=Actinomadura bangladeshensis TaxID=453573 RepID=A0A6L9QK23_9ACTN|nr:S-adenosylmethionine:tRNA ribosyltransferase-isomerase [Actinomadura bangladeshensis]NEA25482.1 S-adenosylmethionine:tRNA ribosyltransferase-isomerase [Actinomadura bangladeshensis]NEA28197.1 S-adenosylmethionine:tRNA ribosyltransferase-isomerase [Actinomadura bangladeshensis]
MTVEFTLPASLEAHEPPEARGRSRDGVRLLVSRRATGTVSHHAFGELPTLLDPGDLLVVNTSATLPAAVRLDRISVHFSTPVPGGDDRLWLVELRRLAGKASRPYGGGSPGEWIPLPGGATLTLVGRRTERLWEARLSTDVIPFLLSHGVPIRYGYVRRDWPAAAYQTAFAYDSSTGSAEMPSAARPFTPDLVTSLVSRGVLIAPITLHTGVASPEAHEPPYAERYRVPPPTAALVEHVRSEGHRVIAVGTTAVRALETAVDASGRVTASSGWTEHIVTPERGVRAVDGLLTGLHEPKSSHLMMLTAIAGTDLLTATYDAALAERYLWHEFGDLNLIL